MTLPRLSLLLAVGLALVAMGASNAEAQDASRSRGSVKVRPRFFNPFDVGGGRFTLSPFGFFTVGVPSAAPAPLDPAPAGAPTAQPADSGDTLAFGAGGVRPPFRPPVRSPFRPPPRPPF
ncbi:MAG TPA: hypothetical protein VJ828_20065 [Lacipirellulaceae bacterium]|nr:hypothetical protein [Lacipirellulaceae bacterium]